MTPSCSCRCFKSGSLRYLSQELVQVSHMLSSMAAERDDLTLRLRVRAGSCPYFMETFGREFETDVAGWDMTPDPAAAEFRKDPEEEYFAQDWEPLYETIRAGDFAPPGDESILTPEEILDFVRGGIEGDYEEEEEEANSK